MDEILSIHFSGENTIHLLGLLMHIQTCAENEKNLKVIFEKNAYYNRHMKDNNATKNKIIPINLNVLHKFSNFFINDPKYINDIFFLHPVCDSQIILLFICINRSWEQHSVALGCVPHFQLTSGV